MEVLKFAKSRNVKSPVRAHFDDAGIDFFIPEDLTIEQFQKCMDITKSQLKLEIDSESKFIKKIYLNPGQSALIPSGIHIKLPDGFALIYFNKSGQASKKHLQIGACVIDQSYTGECHINVSNIGIDQQVLNAGEKITQGIILPINYARTEEIASVDELYKNFNSKRGSGAFGSSGV